MAIEGQFDESKHSILPLSLASNNHNVFSFPHCSYTFTHVFIDVNILSS